MIKERILDFLELVLIILLDCALVIIVAFAMNGVKMTLEHWIFHKNMEQIENRAFSTIFYISEYTLVLSFMIYALLDLYGQIVKIKKRLKNV